MSDYELRRTAYHEAGHAVVAHAVGARLHRVTIKSGVDYLGMVKHARSLKAGTWYENDDRARLRMEREIKIALAGARAVRRAFPGSKWRAGAGSDFYFIGDLVDHVYPSRKGGDDAWRAQGHWQALLEIETDWLLARYWHCIEALAAELLKRETLTGREAKAVIFRANEDRLKADLRQGAR